MISSQLEVGGINYWWAMSYKSRLLNNPIIVWTMANFIGLGAMFLLTLVIPTPVLMTRLATTLIMSIPIGLAQWIALRRFTTITPLWIFTIWFGVVLIPYLPQIIPPGPWQSADDESILVLTTFPFFIGLYIGLAQWLALRRQVRHAILWVPTSAVGLAGGLWFVLVTEIIDTPIVNTILPVLVYCLITGLILNRFLAKHRNSPAEVLAAT
jgi:hypothetical protein